MVISMEGVKAFEKSAMDLQLLHNQINILVFGGVVLVKELLG